MFILLRYFVNLDQLNLLRMMCAQSLSCVQLFVTRWTVAHQAPGSMGFFQPFPPPGLKL